MLTKQEFELLCEGAPASRTVARRDFFAGISATCLVGVVGLLVTAEYFRSSQPQFWAFAFTVTLLAGWLGTGFVALLAHCDTRNKPETSAYAQCVSRIAQRFEA